MKKLKYFAIVLFAGLIVFACSDEEKNLFDENPTSSFDESVIIIHHSFETNSIKITDKEPLIIELKNFDENLILKQDYYIDAVQYTDDGKFNDEVAGDGYYTSIQMFEKSENKSSSVGSINVSDKFKFGKQLQKFKQTAKVKITCKFRTATCTETSWYNSCWPLSSPCTCIEIYECEFEIEI